MQTQKFVSTSQLSTFTWNDDFYLMTDIFVDNWPRYKKIYPNWEIGGSFLGILTHSCKTLRLVYEVKLGVNWTLFWPRVPFLKYPYLSPLHKLLNNQVCWVDEHDPLMKFLQKLKFLMRYAYDGHCSNFMDQREKFNWSNTF